MAAVAPLPSFSQGAVKQDKDARWGKNKTKQRSSDIADTVVEERFNATSLYNHQSLQQQQQLTEDVS